MEPFLVIYIAGVCAAMITVGVYELIRKRKIEEEQRMRDRAQKSQRMRVKERREGRSMKRMKNKIMRKKTTGREEVDVKEESSDDSTEGELDWRTIQEDQWETNGVGVMRVVTD